MPLITPKTDWIAGDSVGFSDMNRIEGNTLYLQNENKTINGTNTFTGLITVGATGITGATNDLILNTNTGNTVDIQINSVDVATFSGSQIDLLKPVEANGNYHIKNASSDTIGTGSLYRLSDSLDSTKSILHQLSADGHLDTWLFFDGSWRRQYRMVRDGRHVIGFNKADNGTDLLQVGSDDDISVSLGRVRTGGVGNIALWGHYDVYSSTGYAIRQSEAGNTRVNASGILELSIANSAIATLSASKIDFLQKLTLEGESTFSVDFSGTREILQIRSKDVLANGAGINLYGSTDSVNPDAMILYADNGVTVSGGGVKTDNEFLKTKIVEIGSWNMTSGGGGSTTKSVAHGLTSSDIRTVKVVIVNDSGNITYPLEYVPFSELSSTTAIPEGSLNVTSTNIAMEIRSGGWWNAGTNLEFDGTQNRGYIEIVYKV